MALGPITNLASAQAADEERKRREQQAALSDEMARLKDELTGLGEVEARSPARLLELKNVRLDDATRRNAEENQFLDQQARRREGRQVADVERRARDLATEGPSVLERTQRMAAPLGEFANEDPNAREAELKTDPRARIPRIDDLIAEVQQGGRPRQAPNAPIYTDAPRARRGADSGDLAYEGALTGLQGAEVPRESIRREFGGTAPDTVLSFSDRSGPGMRPYHSRGGTTKDVGAPGGGFGQIGGAPPDQTEQGALLQVLHGLRAEASSQPLTEREFAGKILTEEPTWDVRAMELANPAAIETALTQGVADGSTDPAIAERLLKKYTGLAKAAMPDGDPFNPDLFRELLGTVKKPAPGEAEARALTPSPIPEAQARERQAVQGALQAPQDGPGSTRSPALTAEQAFVGKPAGGSPGVPTPSPTRTPQIGGPAPEAPAESSGPGWLRTGVGEAARFGLPFAGQAGGALVGGILGRSPGAMNAGRIAGGALGGAGGEAIANYLEDVPVDPKDELVAALLGGVSGPLLQGLGRGGRAAGSAGKGALESIQGYRAAPGVARGFQAVEEARQLGRGAMGAGQQLAGNIAAEGIPGLAQTAIGERGRQLTPALMRMLATRKGPKPSPQELDALLKMIGQ